MCRLQLVKSEQKFDIPFHLSRFAIIAKNSKEFQGHGWGCSYLDENNEWQHYKNIKPIWEDDLNKFPETNLLIAHARSAFQDKGIKIENNMPFHDDNFVFIFNGELRGVKIKEKGRIGAEKIFNFIKKHENGSMIYDFLSAITKLKERTRYIRGLNIILATKNNVYLNSVYGEDDTYFTMFIKEKNGMLSVCSEPYGNKEDWRALPNNVIKTW